MASALQDPLASSDEVVERWQYACVLWIPKGKLRGEHTSLRIIPHRMWDTQVNPLGKLAHERLIEPFLRRNAGPEYLGHDQFPVPVIGSRADHLVDLVGISIITNLINARYLLVLEGQHQITTHARRLHQLFKQNMPRDGDATMRVTPILHSFGISL